METAEKIYKLLERAIENGKMFYFELESEHGDSYVKKEIDMKRLNEKYHILGCDINHHSTNSFVRTNGKHLSFETPDDEFISFEECHYNENCLNISGYLLDGEYVLWELCTVDIEDLINQTIESYQQKIKYQQEIIHKYELTIANLQNIRDEQTR